MPDTDRLGGATTLTGCAASPGFAEGLARVLTTVDEIDALRDGEILVVPLTSPTWGPAFGRIAAIVTDTGGITSHAAIVCRELRLPAVTGTVVGTRTVATGQRIQVNGNAGVVTIVDGSVSVT